MPDTLSNSDLPAFKNLAVRSFERDEDIAGLEAAIAEIKAQSPREYPLVIGENATTQGRKNVSTNPSEPDPSGLAAFPKATRDQTYQAVALAAAAFETWKLTPDRERAAIALRTAEILMQRRNEAVATIVLEAGKNWVEADADLAEAVDFLEFYARETIRYGQSQEVVAFPGEVPESFYIPLGVAAVIPPWNFPLALLTGMTSAALVAGNTVVLKPASDTPLTGQLLVEAFQEAGLPEGALTYLSGSGGEIGDALVDHPQVRLIAFTGSKEVGLRINERAARVHPDQIWIKRVIVEMGGKDAIIVDADVDFDAAARGVVASAFGYQGQKCSACSRLIVHTDVHKPLLDRIVALTADLKVGPTEERTNFMGPVINRAAVDKVLSYVKIGRREGRLVTGGKRLSGAGLPAGGYFVAPTIFDEVQPDSRLAQEEIFGPVLAVIRAKSFDHALELANDTIYGLTGAVYSRDEAHLEQARKAFHVGNLYLNRPCTGALVGVHPFGGFNMSGTDSKAGGRDYLGLFLQAKSVSRKM